MSTIPCTNFEVAYEIRQLGCFLLEQKITLDTLVAIDFFDLVLCFDFFLEHFLIFKLGTNDAIILNLYLFRFNLSPI